MKTIKNLKAEEIRKSILQLAIQGKLVKQDPNDEPASELVKRIYAEKQRLIKEGKIKKDKNESFIFKGDDNCYYEKIGKNEPLKLEDLPFDIPDNWTWIRQKNICWLNNGDKSKGEKLPYLEAKVIRGKSKPIYLEEGVIVDDSIKVILVDGENSGEIMTPPYRGYMGSTFKIFSAVSSFNYEYLLCIFALNKDKYKNSKIGAAIPHLNKELFKESYIAVPPLNEQLRILNKISEIEPLLVNYNKIETQLSILESEFPEKLKKSILQYAIEGKLVKQDPNDEPASVLLERIKAEKDRLIKEGKIKRDKNESYIYQGDDKNYYKNLPLNWSLLPLEKICKVVTCGYASTPKYEESGIPFISAKNVKPYNFLYKDYKFISEQLYRKIHANYKPEKGDILLTRVGAGIGEACIIDVDHDFGIYVSVTLIKLVMNEMNNWILNLLQSPYGLSLSNNNTYGKDASQGNLNVNNVRQFLCPIPPLREQKRILNKLSCINYLLDY